MKFLRSTFYVASLAFSFFFSAFVQADSPVSVSYQANSISVIPTNSTSFKEMHLRVTGPDNSGTTESHSQGEPIVWSSTSESVEGRYVYKILVISDESSTAQRSWQSGSFLVNEYGELVENTSKIQSSDQG